MRKAKLWACGAGAAIAVASGVALWSGFVVAADHTDPPSKVGSSGSEPNKAADIGDIYAWHQGEGAEATLVVVLTYAGPTPPVAGQTAAFDRDVLYAIQIDENGGDGDQTPSRTILVRFGKNTADEWGVKFEGLPGTLGPEIGPVEQAFDAGPNKVWVGLADDPFFFDLQGFQDTLASGTLSFDPTRDFFEGLNISAIVIEMPLGLLWDGTNPVRVWAETRRFPGVN